nr:class I SAM-dependent methyltransferase [Nakamurella flavida]
MPPDTRRVLDLGCGRGTLARRLAALPSRPTVDAVDRDSAMVRVARRQSSPVRWLQADAVTHLLAHPDTYDAICSVAVLHHLPLTETLTAAAGSLRPGGRLVLIALPRSDLRRDLAVQLLAAAAHRAVAAGLLLRQRLTGRDHRLAVEQAADDDDGMPTAAAPLALREVRRAARAVLPGARVRRLLFWRYALVWERPA